MHCAETLSLRTRLAALSRSELVAGIGAVLIVSGLVIRFAGSAIALPAVTLLRSVSDQALTLFMQAFGLLEILIGIALLLLVAAHLRRRNGVADDTDSHGPQP